MLLFISPAVFLSTIYYDLGVSKSVSAYKRQHFTQFKK